MICAPPCPVCRVMVPDCRAASCCWYRARGRAPVACWAAVLCDGHKRAGQSVRIGNGNAGLSQSRTLFCNGHKYMVFLKQYSK